MTASLSLGEYGTSMAEQINLMSVSPIASLETINLNPQGDSQNLSA
jgi:hypothetical protein